MKKKSSSEPKKWQNTNVSAPRPGTIHTDYAIYRPDAKEVILYLALGLMLGAAVCWLCYNDLRSLPLAVVICLVFFLMKKKELAKKRRQDLLYHFKDLVTSLHAALRAGYSVENGIVSAAKDVELLYGEKDILVREMKTITAQLRVRIRAEDLFLDLGERSGLDDIRIFAELLAVGKKTGGDMNKMMMQTARILCDKIDTKQEIEAQIASKAFEQKIMSLMPACIIIYLRLSFPGFVEVLYGSLFGCAAMSICLIVYAAAFIWGKKIVSIEVW